MIEISFALLFEKKIIVGSKFCRGLIIVTRKFYARSLYNYDEIFLKKEYFRVIRISFIENTGIYSQIEAVKEQPELSVASAPLKFKGHINVI